MACARYPRLGRAVGVDHALRVHLDLAGHYLFSLIVIISISVKSRTGFLTNYILDVYL